MRAVLVKGWIGFLALSYWISNQMGIGLGVNGGGSGGLSTKTWRKESAKGLPTTSKRDLFSTSFSTLNTSSLSSKKCNQPVWLTSTFDSIIQPSDFEHLQAKYLDLYLDCHREFLFIYFFLFEVHLFLMYPCNTQYTLNSVLLPLSLFFSLLSI